MKKLIIIFLLFGWMSAKAWQPDKTKHLVSGALISASTQIVVYELTGNKNKSQIIGFSAALAAGIAKELYDSTGRGTPELADIGATVLGATITIPIRWTQKN